ncbi:hypothetical protein NKH18_01610 [Streptomyces sp. M10(2022)]
MTNTSAVERRWALWNVTQIAGAPPASPAGAEGVYLGRARSGRPSTVPLVAGTGRPQVLEAAADVLYVPHQDVVGKVGFPDSAGWLAHVGPERTLAQGFTVHEGSYPDEGSRAEVWMECPLAEGLPHLGGLRPRDHVVECEALGPLTTLAPGRRPRWKCSSASGLGRPGPGGDIGRLLGGPLRDGRTASSCRTPQVGWKRAVRPGRSRSCWARWSRAGLRRPPAGGTGALRALGVDGTATRRRQGASGPHHRRGERNSHPF